MGDATHPALALWSNFYLITGSAAAALTGLQFIVQTLLASDVMKSVTQVDPEGGIAAFGSPTVVHFSIALMISVVLCAPWPGFGVLRVTLALIALAALVYSAVVMRRTHRQQGYAPTLYDWTWHVVLPSAAYASLLVAAMLIGPHGTVPFFLLGAATMLLLCIGIHNSWDTVTYLTVEALRRRP